MSKRRPTTSDDEQQRVRARVDEEQQHGEELVELVELVERVGDVCPEPRRLVMVKFECHFEGCDRGYDVNDLCEHTSAFVPNGLFGLFYCGACGDGRLAEIRAKVRNASGLGLCLPAEAICRDIGALTLVVKRSSGVFEDSWTLLPWNKFVGYGNASRAPLRLVDGVVYVEVMMEQDGDSLRKSCTLEELLEWNPTWRPELCLDGEDDLSEENAAKWRQAMKRTRTTS